MKKLIFLFLLFFLPTMGWGATTHYVCKNVDATNHVKYSTTSFAHCSSSGTPRTDLSDMRNVVSNGDTMIIDGGPVGGSGVTYSGTELFSVNRVVMTKNITIRGLLPTEPEYETNGKMVTIDVTGATGADGIVCTTGCTVGNDAVRNMTIKNSPTSYYGLSGTTGYTTTVKKVLFENNWGHIKGSGTVVLDHAYLKNSTDNAIYQDVAGSAIAWIYSTIDTSGKNGFDLRSGTVTATNGSIFGCQRGAVLTYGTGSPVVAFSNVLMFLNALSQDMTSIRYPLYSGATGASAAGTFNNCLIMHSPIQIDSSGHTLYGQGTGGATWTFNNCKYLDPKFMSNKRNGYGYTSVRFDDSWNLPDISTMMNYLDTKGIKATVALTDMNSYTSYVPTIQSWVANGHEICNHGLTHAILDKMSVLTITGPANSYVDITTTQTAPHVSSWTGTITLDVGGTPVSGWDNRTLVYTGDSNTINVLGIGTYNLITAINAIGGGWSAAMYVGAETDAALRAEESKKLWTVQLASSGRVAVSSGHTFDLNKYRYWYSELVDQKYLLESAIGSGYKIKTYCGNSRSVITDELRQYLDGTASQAQTDFAALGLDYYTGANWSYSSYGLSSYSLGDDITSGTPVSGAGLNIWETSSHTQLTFEPYSASPDLTKINSEIDSIMMWLDYVGGYRSIVLHGLTTNGNSMSYAQFTGIIDAIKRNADDGTVKLFTVGGFINHVRTSGSFTSNDSGRRWTRTFSDLSDYRLRCNSPAKGAGLFVAGIHDQAGCKTMDGKACYRGTNTVDIGAYGAVCASGGGFSLLGNWLF